MKPKGRQTPGFCHTDSARRVNVKTTGSITCGLRTPVPVLSMYIIIPESKMAGNMEGESRESICFAYVPPSVQSVRKKACYEVNK
jgi:hypothetical protein